MLMHEPFDFHAQSRGDYDFARCGTRRMTYAEAKARSEHIAAALAAQGFGHGDRLCMLMRNSIDVLLLIFACSRLGIVLVPLNYRLAPPEWVNLIVDSGAVAIVADVDFVADLDGALGTLRPQPALALICVSGERDGWMSLEALVALTTEPLKGANVAPTDTMFQVYTSGTTGKAKGALLSHHNIVYNIFQSNLAAPHKPSPGERTLVVLPLFHMAAICTAVGAIFCGGCLMIHRDVDPKAIAHALAEDEIVTATLVPSIIQFLIVGVPEIADMKFPRLKTLAYGASPIAEPVLRRALEIFDCHLAQGYGMTELAGPCSMLIEADHRRALLERPELLLSAGRALPGCSVRVVGPNDEDLPPGTTGEIIVRGDQVMSGYWQMPEASAEALRGGWMHTGDAGFLDEEGYLFIRDRMKDMIVSGGENIYPAEIEAVLYEHPAVADVAVIGVPDARWGETVMAIVVIKPNIEVSENELDAFCRTRLGGFKVPRRYAFMPALPRNATGKILKRELRELHWTDQSRRVS